MRVIQTCQLNASNCSLDFKHSPVGAEAFMEPAESRRVIPLIYRLVTFSVVLERPSLPPCGLIVHCQKTAFSASRDDFILTEAESSEVTKTTHRPIVNHGSMRLRSIFDYTKVVVGCELHQRRHVNWPAPQMYWYDCPSSMRNKWFYG